MMGRFRRAAIRSLALLLGRKKFSFDGGSYSVADGVLNPTLFRASLIFARETMEVAGANAIDILELGSGSGLASVALARKGHRVTAVDCSFEAALNTVTNARGNGVIVRTVLSDWDTSLEPHLTFDLVVTNPPFLSLATSILKDALWGGPNLCVVEQALKAARRRVRAEGRVLLLTSERSGRKQVLQAVQSSGLTIVTNRTVSQWGEKLHVDTLAQLPCASQ